MRKPRKTGTRSTRGFSLAYTRRSPPSQRYGGASEFRGSKMTLEFSSQFFFRAHSRNPRRRVAAATEEDLFGGSVSFCIRVKKFEK
jgi:hypothetical protein